MVISPSSIVMMMMMRQPRLIFATHRNAVRVHRDAMREFITNKDENVTVAIERIDFHAKRVFASLSEEKRTGCLFENDWQKCRDALEKVTRTAFLKRRAGFKKGRYMATIAIEDDRDEKKMNVHALLTPLITTRKDEKKGDEEVTALDRYALLRGAERAPRPHAKHTEWVKKREGLEIERNKWNAREDDVKEKQINGETRRKRTFVECVLSKRTGSGSALQEEDFQICEGLTTSVFVLKRDDAHSNGSSNGGLILQTAPDADVLLGVARRAILDAFPSSKNDSEEARVQFRRSRRDAKIRLSLTHPLWSERETWIALFRQLRRRRETLPRHRQLVHGRGVELSTSSNIQRIRS